MFGTCQQAKQIYIHDHLAHRLVVEVSKEKIREDTITNIIKIKLHIILGSGDSKE